jgi:hypothetical protein
LGLKVPGVWPLKREASHQAGKSDLPALLFRLTVNKLSINLSSEFVYNEDFKVLIIPQTVIAEVKRHRFAVLDPSASALNTMPTRSLIGMPSFISKKTFA